MAVEPTNTADGFLGVALGDGKSIEPAPSFSWSIVDERIGSTVKERDERLLSL